MKTPITDSVGVAAKAARTEFLRMYQIALALCAFLLTGSIAANVYQYSRPPVVFGYRVDDSGRITALRVRDDKNFTVREAEVQTAVRTWILDRFRLVRPLIATNFPENYYFLDDRLVRHLTATDAEVVAKIQQGILPEQDVEIKGITFRDFQARHDPDGTIGTGEVVVEFFKLYDTTGPDARQRFEITLKYKVNPMQVAALGPEAQSANGMGFQISYFHEDRVI
jgi:hypothetical protein